MRDLILPKEERDALERRIPTSFKDAAVWFREVLKPGIHDSNEEEVDEALDEAAACLENLTDLAMQVGYQRGYEYGEAMGVKASKRADPPTLRSLVKKLRKRS